MCIRDSGHVYNKENMPKGPYEAMIYGHSHLWELSHNEKGQAIVNTGSITFPKGGNPPTFATLEDGKFTMYQLDTLEVLATMEAWKSESEKWIVNVMRNP